jgi:RNA polymerase sigma factor (sigma-70 family)
MSASVDSTSALIPAVARGDLTAFEAVYDRYSGTLYALLLRILGNADDAQEVLQEAFVKAWTNAKTFDAVRGSEVAWLISIARSKGIDKLRSRKIRSDRENDAGREISIQSNFVDKTTGAVARTNCRAQRARRIARGPAHRTRACVLRRALAVGDQRTAERAPRHGEDTNAARDEETARPAPGVPMTTHEEYQDVAALDAIGAASPDEERDLREHLAGCEECRRVRDEYAEAVTLLARGLEPVTPPEELREMVVAAEGQDNVVDARRRFGGAWWLATAATLFLALWGWRELAMRVEREKVTTQQAEIRRLAEENARLAQRNDRLNAEMAALASADTQQIALSGQQVAPAASARVFLEPQRRRAIVFFNNLPANAKDKSYQLWIIAGDKPRSAGVFDVVDGKATISIENLPVSTEIKALAVTLEPRGGVAQPTNTNFYVMGKSSL